MRSSSIVGTGMAVAVAVALASPVYAQSEGGPGWSQFGPPAFIGRSNAMGPNCPAIEFHVIPGAKNQLSGVAIEQTPLPGTSPMKLYTISGTLADDGKLAMDLKPVGEGESVKVQGTFRQAMLMASIAGRGTCHSASFMLMPAVIPMPPPNQ